MKKFYGRQLCFSSMPVRDLSPVDIVVIYLGCNDFEARFKTDPDNASHREEFVKGYADLLATVRLHRPDIPILCLLPGASSAASMGTKDLQQRVSEILHALIPQAVEKAGGKSAGI